MQGGMPPALAALESGSCADLLERTEGMQRLARQDARIIVT